MAFIEDLTMTFRKDTISRDLKLYIRLYLHPNVHCSLTGHLFTPEVEIISIFTYKLVLAVHETATQTLMAECYKLI